MTITVEIQVPEGAAYQARVERYEGPQGEQALNPTMTAFVLPGQTHQVCCWDYSSIMVHEEPYVPAS